MREIQFKLNYLSEDEAKMDLKSALLQITLGLQGCETKGDVVELLEDVVELGRRDEQKKIIEWHRQHWWGCAAYSEGMDCCVEKITGREDIYDEV